MPELYSRRMPRWKLVFWVCVCAGACPAAWAASGTQEREPSLTASVQPVGAPAQSPSSIQALAMHGDARLPPGFTHLPYVNPEAAKGGRLVLGQNGSFDSLNPFIFGGTWANGVQDFVYERLMFRSADEPFTLYGLIAKTVEVPEDRGSITFHLDPAARFSDGRPVTADDVIFTHMLLRDSDHAHPFTRGYHKKVRLAERLDGATVRFTFAAADDREMPLIIGLMPVLPRHRMTAEAFNHTSLAPPLGSGPYVVDKVDAGKSITFRRNADYWGRDLPVNRGRFNFDVIRYDYFRDANTLFESFKTGEIDLREETGPGRWAEGYDIPQVQQGRIVKAEFPTGLPDGMTGLVFNTRRPLFADPRVRQALILLFDFDWINRNLFHGLYSRSESYFARSDLASTGHPADARERALLAPYLSEIKPQILAGTYRLPTSDGSGLNREHLREAMRLLNEAGWELQGGRLVQHASRQPLGFEFLALNRDQEKLMLAFSQTLQRVGITVSIRLADEAQYWKRLQSHDFDMMQYTWTGRISPGNEQYNRWNSNGAEAEGTLNFPGVKSPAVDAAIDALVAARTREELVSIARALDRALLSGDYVIPLFHLPRQWIAHSARLKHPEVTPLAGAQIDAWWEAGH